MASETAEERFKKRLARDGVLTYPVTVPMASGDLETLEDALRIVEEECERSDGCDNENGGSCGQDYICSYCRTVEIRDRMRTMLQPVHRTINPDRQGNIAEHLFLKRWIALQKREPGLNHGWGLLEMILMPTRFCRDEVRYVGDPPPYVPPVSQRDAEVAATVIQWLGTSCGGGFLWETEKQINEASGVKNNYERRYTQGIQNHCEPPLDVVEMLAREVAGRFHNADSENYRHLAQRVTAAIDTATDKLRGMLLAVVTAFQNLVSESDGVAGLHKNGELASWITLCRGGRFEEWCGVFDDAAALLATARKEKTDATNELPTDNPPVSGTPQAGYP